MHELLNHFVLQTVAQGIISFMSLAGLMEVPMANQNSYRNQKFSIADNLTDRIPLVATSGAASAAATNNSGE